MTEYKKSISVITATYNAERDLPRLIDSLRGQTDKDFEWVVADGASTDGTLALLNAIDDLNIKITSQEDFGIYDALNRGIKACSGDYYLVLGADDKLFPNAIEQYRAAIDSDTDMITAWIRSGDRILKPNRGPSWRFGQMHWVSAHAVGLLIKKSLHKKFGFYSRKLPIAADQLFIKQCCQSGCRVKTVPLVVGEFGQEGVSSVDTIGMCMEFFYVQFLTENKKWLVLFLFLKRLTTRLMTFKATL